MKNNLIISKQYRANTAEGTIITPLVQLTSDSAIFIVPTIVNTCSNRFQPTPFIKWNFYRVDNTNDTIDVCSGRYYKTLEDALADNNLTEQKPILKLVITYRCPLCNDEFQRDYDCHEFQQLIEQIEDDSICHCGNPIVNIIAIVLTDGENKYDLKLPSELSSE